MSQAADSNSSSVPSHLTFSKTHLYNLETAKIMLEIDFRKHIDEIQQGLRHRAVARLIGQNIPQQLIRKKIITSADEFNAQEAVRKTNEVIERQIDKLESWTITNMCQKPFMVEARQNLEHNNVRIDSQIERIGAIADRYSARIKQRRLAEVLQKLRVQRLKLNIIPEAPQVYMQSQRAAERTKRFITEIVQKTQNQERKLEEKIAAMVIRKYQ